MDDIEHKKQYLERLRGWRNRPAKDLSLKFLAEQFKREVARPHKQLGEVTEVWQRLIPAELLSQTALASLSRGTLTVHVGDSGVLYELDRLMRGGLERQLMGSCKATLKRVKIMVKR